jgi:hypothetical protein
MVCRFSGYVHPANGERRNRDYLMLFASETGLHILRTCSDVFIDGTFGTVKSVPPFSQIIFIQAKIQDKRALPVAFALLTRKVSTSLVYVDIFFGRGSQDSYSQNFGALCFFWLNKMYSKLNSMFFKLLPVRYPVPIVKLRRCSRHECVITNV